MGPGSFGLQNKFHVFDRMKINKHFPRLDNTGVLIDPERQDVRNSICCGARKSEQYHIKWKSWIRKCPVIKNTYMLSMYFIDNF